MGKPLQATVSQGGKNKVFHILYKTINIVNGKIYIGVHSTRRIRDGYIGCGIKRLSDAKKNKNSAFSRAVMKYGMHNFIRYDLEFFECRKQALDREREIVDRNHVLDHSNYNCAIGGGGSLTMHSKYMKNYDFIITLFKSGVAISKIANDLNCSSSGLRKFIQREVVNYKDYVSDLSPNTYEVYNLNHDLVFSGTTLEVSSFLKIRKDSVKNVLKEKCIIHGKYYITREGIRDIKLSDFNNNRKRRVDCKKVVLLKDNANSIVFNSCGDAASALGLNRQSIATVCSGRRNSVFGYRFRYI